MFKVVVDDKIVDLLGDNITYVKVRDPGGCALCDEKEANGVIGIFGNIYQIKNRKNIDSKEYPICTLLSIQKEEYDNLYKQLSQNIIISNVEDLDEVKEDGIQPINLLNKITELEAKLNELLNK